MAITICVGNYKGGVGKTKNCILSAYELAKKGKKCLVIDLDPQANATTVLIRTKKLHSDDIFSFNRTLMSATREGDLTGLEVEICNNLYLLPSYIDFSNYPTFLDLKFGLKPDRDPDYNVTYGKKISYLSTLIEGFKKEYDYIFIDVPPTKSYITDSAVLASDYVLIVLQTQELSLNGAVLYLNDLRALSESYNADFEICGVLPVLLDTSSSLDNFILSHAKDIFGEGNLFKTHVPGMDRLKRFDNTGITERDKIDKKVIAIYEQVATELVQRIDFFEKIKEEAK